MWHFFPKAKAGHCFRPKTCSRPQNFHLAWLGTIRRNSVLPCRGETLLSALTFITLFTITESCVCCCPRNRFMFCSDALPRGQWQFASLSAMSAFPREIVFLADCHRDIHTPVNRANYSPFHCRNCTSSPNCTIALCTTHSFRRTTACTSGICTDQSIRSFSGRSSCQSARELLSPSVRVRLR